MGPKGALESPPEVGRPMLPHWAPQPVWALPSLPFCPGTWRKERNGAHAGRGSPKGPLGCPVSTEKSDAAHVSWKQAGEAGQECGGGS